MIKRLVVSQNKHITSSNLDEQFQFGLKSGHNTETTLLNVTDPPHCAVTPVNLYLLSLSEAFDRSHRL